MGRSAGQFPTMRSTVPPYRCREGERGRDGGEKFKNYRIKKGV